MKRKYSDKDLAEMAAMGYNMDSRGNLIKETPLQRTIRVKDGLKECQLLSLAKPLVTTVRYLDKVVSKTSVRSTRTGYSSVKASYTDSERKARGLVTKKQPGIVYTLLSDGTKVCRCCQDRKPAKHYYNARANKDKLSYTCIDCERLQTIDYTAGRKLYDKLKVK